MASDAEGLGESTRELPVKERNINHIKRDIMAAKNINKK